MSEVTVALEVLPPLQPGEKFAATVKVADESGNPIKNAVVRVFNSEHKPITTKVTDANGEVVIRDLMLGYVLRAERKVTTFVLNENGAAIEKTSVSANDRLFYKVFPHQQ